MHITQLQAEDDFTGWRNAARVFASAKIPADQIIWKVGDGTLDMFTAQAPPLPPTAPFSVSKEFVQLAKRVVLHQSPERFALLYTLLIRLSECPALIGDRTDPLVHRLTRMAKAVNRDSHKMHAFVRFQECAEGDERRFVAWFEPEHYIVRANAQFFIGRFANMRWSIFTPFGSIHWDGAVLSEGPPTRRPTTANVDPIEAVWKAYYAATFNPARVMVDAMCKEMPKKYWKNMPETALIPELLASARRRESEMISAIAPARIRRPKP